MKNSSLRTRVNDHLNSKRSLYIKTSVGILAASFLTVGALALGMNKYSNLMLEELEPVEKTAKTSIDCQDTFNVDGEDVELEKLIDFYRDNKENPFCFKLRGILGTTYSDPNSQLDDLRSLVHDYVKSRRSPLVVKDGQDLFDQMVYPREKSKCKAHSLMRTFADKMLELYPNAVSLLGGDKQDYVVLKINDESKLVVLHSINKELSLNL